jgi:hypothetical protein
MRMKYCSQKDIDRMIRELVRAGATYRHGGKHGKLRLPSGIVLTVPNTPGSRNAAKCFAGAVKRAGWLI